MVCITWDCLFSATNSGHRNIVVQLTASRTFLKPPYNWQLGSLGLLSLAGFIGAVLAFYLGGRLIDIISTRSTARHDGIRMPEYRLPAIVIPGIIGPAGILIFGLCVAYQTHWVGPAFGNAMQAFGVAAISNVAVTYSLDSYKPVCYFLLSSAQLSWTPLLIPSSGDRRGIGDHLCDSKHDWHAFVPLRGGLDRAPWPGTCFRRNDGHPGCQYSMRHPTILVGTTVKSLHV
jgi:MFS family permease